jgi:hypothetical protein
VHVEVGVWVGVAVEVEVGVGVGTHNETLAVEDSVVLIEVSICSSPICPIT